MRITNPLRTLVMASVAVACLAVFGAIGSAAPPYTLDRILAGNPTACPDCPEMRTATAPLAVSTVWTVREAASAVASAGCPCGASCACADSAAAMTVSRFERAVLFPRVRTFVSSVAERNPKPLRRIVIAVATRFRR